MLDTIQNGDVVLVWKSLNSKKLYLSNQVVLFSKILNGEKISFVKRIAATPNDSITANTNEIIVNGKAYPHDPIYFTISGCPKDTNAKYFKFLTEQSIGNEKFENLKINTWFDDKSVTVPPEYYFLIGDNPYESMDSRFWGFVHEDQIIGKVIAIF